MSMTELNPAQAASRIALLLASPESRTLEFKRIGAKHGRLIETVCAFANSDGGVLALGVDDARNLKPGAKPESRLFGVEENAESFDDFRRHGCSALLRQSKSCTGCACLAHCATASPGIW